MDLRAQPAQQQDGYQQFEDEEDGQNQNQRSTNNQDQNNSNQKQPGKISKFITGSKEKIKNTIQAPFKKTKNEKNNVNEFEIDNNNQIEKLSPQTNNSFQNERISMNQTEEVQQKQENPPKKQNILQQAINSGKNLAVRTMAATKNKAMDKYKSNRRNLSLFVKKKQEDTILKGLSIVKPKAKKKFQDPFLYKPIRNMMDQLFEENWALVVEHVQFSFRMKQMEPYLDLEKRRLNCFQKIAAKFNYIMQPNDKSLGKQLRDWKYMLFTFLSVCPYGIQSLFYTFQFICMDKKDEYQLIYFIVNYKKMQCITQGFFLGVYGYMSFYNCVVLADLSQGDSVYKDCKSIGPGAGSNVYIQMISFLTNIVLIWFCAILLPFSVQKGRPKFKAVEDIEGKTKTEKIEPEKPKGCCSCLNWDRGGMMKKLMLFDLGVFLLALFLYLKSYHDLQIDDIKNSGPEMAFSRWIYGILSFPFLLFNVPIFLNLLTNSKDTTYDQDGNCVPPKTDLCYEEVEGEEEADLFDLNDVEEGQIDKVIDQINLENSQLAK